MRSILTDSEKTQLFNLGLQKYEEKINLVYLENLFLKKANAQLAHDIRAPLSAINILINNNPSISETHKNIIKNALIRIADITDTAKLKTGRIQIQKNKPIKTDLIIKTIEEIISEKEIVYNEKNITFYLGLNKYTQKFSTYIDIPSFKRIMSNLIDNSIEAIHSSGYVAINLRTKMKLLNIEIKDTGYGISKVALKEILKNDLSIGKPGGSGLGLSHARQCIRSWNGRFKIKSTINQGTIVNLYLPAFS